MFAVKSESGMTSAYSGILGMNPSSYFIEALKDNSIIANRVFCFGLRLSTQTSFLDIGNVVLSNTKGGTIYYVPANADYWWWANYITGVKLGSGQNLDNAYTLTSYKAYTDTMAACTHIPPAYYSLITGMIM